MKRGSLAALGVCLCMSTAPVYGKEIKTDTRPEVYATVKGMEEALEGYPAVKELGLEPYKAEKDQGTYVIPGLQKSASLSFSGKPSTCDCMTPQGITVTDDYLMISAYCHDHVHHSVIWVLDKDTHEYVKTVVLEGMPHTGSIAYDAAHDVVWVATHVKGKATASTISMDDIESSQETKAVPWQRTFELEGLPVDSCLCMDQDSLVAGTFEKTGEVHIRWYDIGSEGLKGREEKIRPKETRTFGANLQGIAVADGHVITASSDGPDLTSKLTVYPEDMEDLDKPVAQVDLPPRLEQISLSGSVLYANFESGAKPYRDEGVVVDRVLSLDMDRILKTGK